LHDLLVLVVQVLCGGGGTLITSSALALRLHEHYLRHRPVFRASVGTRRLYDRFSINCIAFLGGGSLARVAARLGRDDEETITTTALRAGHVEKVYLGFVVAHTSFQRQEGIAERVIEMYRAAELGAS
jgi:hypothetical protein